MGKHRHAAPAPVDGNNHTNTFNGTALADRFDGYLGTDFMFGGQGADTLYGYSGKDQLTGGTGQDVLYGGNGNDLFIYNSVADASDPTSSDWVMDFKSGQDKFVLSSFMAGGHFSGTALEADGTKQVAYDKASGILSGDVNGDGVADFTINIANHANLVATDFLF